MSSAAMLAVGPTRLVLLFLRKKLPRVELLAHPHLVLGLRMHISITLRFSILCDVMQHRLVASYRRFRTTYWPYLGGTSCPRICDRKAVPKRRQLTANLRCLTSQKSEEPVYTAAEA